MTLHNTFPPGEGTAVFSTCAFMHQTGMDEVLLRMLNV